MASGAASLEEICEQVLACLQSLLGAERAAILLVSDREDASAGGLRVAAWRGLSEKYRQALESDGNGDGPCPWRLRAVADAGEPAPVVPTVIEDTAADPGMARDILRSEGIGALVCIPLARAPKDEDDGEGKRLGELLIAYREPRHFSEAELVLAETVAGHVVLALPKARAQEKHRHSASELDTILRSVSDGITVQDPAGRLTFANDAAARIVGFDRADEMLQATPDEIVQRFELLDEHGLPLPVERIPSRIARVHLKPAIDVVRFRIRAGGRTRISLISSTPVLADDGSLRFVVNSFRDVSWRQQSERSAQLLARAAGALSGTLNLHAILDGAARAAIPMLGDMCLVALCVQGSTAPAWAVVHTRAEREEELRRILLYEEPGQSLSAALPELMQDSMGPHVPHPLAPLVAHPGMQPVTSHIMVPLWSDGRASGVLLVLAAESGLMHEAGELELLRELASRISLAVDNARAHEAARRAEAEARRAAERAARLQRVTAALSSTSSIQTIADLIVRECAAALGAFRSALFQVDKSGEYVLPLASVGYDEEMVARFRRMPINLPMPAITAIRESRAIWLSSKEERLREFPALRQLQDELDEGGLAALPLIVDGCAIGGLGFQFADSGFIADEDREMAQAIAAQCAQALERARLYEEERQARTQAEVAHRRAAYLDEASAILSSSLDVALTLERVARLAVPGMADWAAVEVADDSPEGVKPVAVCHSDPDKVELAHELRRRYPPDPTAPRGVTAVIRTGKSELYEHITDADLVAGARDEEHLQIARDLTLRSAIIVPMTARGRTLGAITFFMAESGRHYTQGDLIMAEELGERAGTAIDNAMLYEAQHRARSESEAAAERTGRLQAVAAALSGVVTANDAAAVAAREVCLAVSGAAAALVALREGDRIKVAAAEGLSADQIAAWEASAAQASQAPWEAPDAAHLIVVAMQTEHEEGMHTWAAIPLPVAGRPIGALVLGFTAERRFTDEERELMLAIGRQAAIAIARAQHIEELRIANERLSDSNRTLETLIQASPLAITVMDETGIVKLWNPAAESIFGWSADEVIGRFSPTGEKGFRGSFLTSLERVIAGEHIEGSETRRVTKDRGIIDVAIWAAPIRGPFGAVHCLALIADITDRKRAERALRQSEERARRAYLAAKKAERRKDEFLAMLGHELRNPLAPIVTALHLLDLRGDQETARERTIISRQVEHLKRLVDDLLDVSRITRGKLQLRRELVTVSDIIAKAIEVASPLFEQRNHELVVSVPPEEMVVQGDPVRLAQVISNLLTNAAKYTEPGGRIEVRARREGEQAAISIIDNGIGIDDILLPQVFDLFVQAPKSLDRAGGGLGLGLTIVRQLVEMHGGQVSAHSEGVGKGAEFVVRLPLGKVEAPKVDEPAERPAASLSARPTASRRVLIVDDNLDAAEMLSSVLLARGHTTAVAHDGPSALVLAHSFQPEVALLDIGLPVMDGYELAERLRADRGRDVRLVAITGYGQSSDQERARAAGFDAHLVKPVSIDAVMAAVDGTLPLLKR